MKLENISKHISIDALIKMLPQGSFALLCSNNKYTLNNLVAEFKNGYYRNKIEKVYHYDGYSLQTINNLLLQNFYDAVFITQPISNILDRNIGAGDYATKSKVLNKLFKNKKSNSTIFITGINDLYNKYYPNRFMRIVNLAIYEDASNLEITKCIWGYKKLHYKV